MDNQQNKFGRPIVTTQKRTSIRAWSLRIFGVVFIIIGFIMIGNFETLKYSFGGAFDDYSLGGIIAILISVGSILYGLYSLAVGFFAMRSHCKVCEFGVEGITAMNFKNKENSLVSFSLPYEKIDSVREKGTLIILYTQHEKYEVLALINRKDAIAEIEQRISNK